MTNYNAEVPIILQVSKIVLVDQSSHNFFIIKTKRIQLVTLR